MGHFLFTGVVSGRVKEPHIRCEMLFVVSREAVRPIDLVGNRRARFGL